MYHIYKNISLHVHEFNSAHEKSMKCFQKAQSIIVYGVMMVTGYFQPRSVSAVWLSGCLLKGAHLVTVIGADRSALARNTFGDPGLIHT